MQLLMSLTWHGQWGVLTMGWRCSLNGCTCRLHCCSTAARLRRRAAWSTQPRVDRDSEIARNCPDMPLPSACLAHCAFRQLVHRRVASRFAETVQQAWERALNVDDWFAPQSVLVPRTPSKFVHQRDRAELVALHVRDRSTGRAWRWLSARRPAKLRSSGGVLEHWCWCPFGRQCPLGCKQGLLVSSNEDQVFARRS